MSSKRFRSSISVIMASAVLVTAFPSAVLADAPVSVSIISPSSLVFDKNGDTLNVVVRYDSLPTTAGTTVKVELIDGSTVLASGSATGTDGVNSTTTVPVQITGVANGTYGLQATVHNAEGDLVATQSAIVVIDSVRPVADVSNPANYSRISGEVTIVGTADDDNLVNWKLEASLGGQGPWVTYGSGNLPVINDTLATINTATLPDGDGTYTIRLTVTDAAGNTKSSTVSAVVDNFAPTALISSPAAGSLQKGTVSIKGTASDANISSWTLESAPGGTTTWTTRKTGSGNVVNGTLVSLDTALLGDGDVDLRLTVQDAAGQSKVSTRSFTVDNTAPAVSILAPLNAAKLSGPLTVTGAVSDTHLTNYVVEMKLVSATAWTQIGGGVANASGTLATLNSTTLADGPYEIRVTATDAVGTTNEAQVAVTVDNFVPVVDFTAPADGVVITGSLAVTGTVTDGNLTNWVVETSVSGDDIWTTRGSGTGPITAGTLATIDSQLDLGDGVFDIRVTATDSFGRTTDQWAMVTVDNTNPSAIIASPTPGAVVTGTVSVTGTASDANLTGYQLEISPAGANTWTLIPVPFAPVPGAPLGSFDSKQYADGLYDLRLTVTDAVGHKSVATVTTKIDNVKPVATISVPATGSLVKGSVTFTGAATDGNLTGWSLKVSPTTLNSWTTLSSGTASFTGDLATLDTKSLPDGFYDVELSVTDAANNTVTKRITLTVDNTAPVVSLTSPVDGDMVYTFDGSVTDPHLTYYVIEYRLAGTGTWAPMGGGTTSTTGTLLTPNLSQYADGNYDFRLTANDSLGNVTTSPVVTAWIDTQSPVIELASPADKAKVKGSITISGTATDGTLQDWSLEISGDGGATWSTLNSGITSITGTLASINTAGYSDGAYLLRLTVNDIGDVYDVTTNLTIDNSLPTATITAPLSGVPVKGPLAITGAADDINFASYTVAISPSGANTWTDIYTGAAKVAGPGLLATLDTATLIDGAYDIKLTVVDAVGNKNTAQVTGLVVDNSPPTAGILAPVGGPVVSGNALTIKGTADDAHLTSWTLERSPAGTGSWTTVNSGTVKVAGGALGTIDTTTLLDGSYDLRLTVTDSLGQSQTATYTLTVDNTKPTIVITAPTSGASVHGTLNLIGTVADDNFATYQVERRAVGELTWTPALQDTAPVTAGTLYSIDTSALADGAYELRVSVTDKAGNTQESILAFAADNTPPSAGITGPADGAVRNGTIIVIGTANDANLQSWTLEISQAGADAWSPLSNGTMTIIDNALAIYDSATQAEGAYDLRLTVTDLAGNTKSVISSYKVDRTAPTVSITAPLADAKLHGTVSIQGSVSDANLNFYQVHLSPAGAGDWTQLRIVTAASASGELASWDTTTLKDGTYDVMVTGTDAIGLYASFTVTVSVDNTVPVAQVTDPVAGENHRGTLTVTGTATDANLKDWSLAIAPAQAPGIKKSMWTPVNSGNTAVVDGALGTVDTTGLADGDYTLRLVVTDEYGNDTTTTTTITLDNTVATAAITFPSANGTVDGTVKIKGSVADAHLDTWTLGYAAGSDNVGPYTVIATGTTAVTANTLGIWDTRPLADGNYTVTLIVTDKAGNTTTVTRNVLRKKSNSGGGGGGGVVVIPTPDTTAPVLGAVTATIPEWITKGGDAVIKMHGSMTDANPDHLTLVLRGADGVAVLEVKADGKEGDLSLTIPASVADGIYSVVLLGVDKAGNTTEQTVQSVGIQRSALVAPKLAAIPALTNKAIALDWSSSPGSSSVGIKRYTILRSVNGGEFVQVGETTGKTFSESVITPGTVSYKVVLESKSGLTTAVTTDSIEVRTAIPAPVLKSMPGLTTQKLINVGWSSVGVDGAEYDLYRTGPNGQVLVAANLTVTAFTDLVPGAAIYTYTVQAKDAAGNKAQSAGAQIAVAADVPVAETTANQAPVYVTVGGRFITGDAPAFVRDSRTYAPVRFVAEAFGATVSFDQATQTVKIVGKDGRVVTIVVGSKVLTVTKPDGSVSTIEMDAAAFIENGRTYIPVRFVAEALGLKVSFDSVNRIVLIAE